MARRIILIAAIVCFFCAAFDYTPFGSFHFGWMGLALVAGALAI